jgi:hypothetical protein
MGKGSGQCVRVALSVTDSEEESQESALLSAQESPSRKALKQEVILQGFSSQRLRSWATYDSIFHGTISIEHHSIGYSDFIALLKELVQLGLLEQTQHIRSSVTEYMLTELGMQQRQPIINANPHCFLRSKTPVLPPPEIIILEMSEDWMSIRAIARLTQLNPRIHMNSLIQLGFVQKRIKMIDHKSLDEWYFRLTKEGLALRKNLRSQ